MERYSGVPMKCEARVSARYVRAGVPRSRRRRLALVPLRSSELSKFSRQMKSARSLLRRAAGLAKDDPNFHQEGKKTIGILKGYFDRVAKAGNKIKKVQQGPRTNQDEMLIREVDDLLAKSGSMVEAARRLARSASNNKDMEDLLDIDLAVRITTNTLSMFSARQA